MTRGVSLSIERRLPLLIGGAILLVIVAFASVAYLEVRRDAHAVAEDRLSDVTEQLARLLESQVGPVLSQARRTAADAAILAYVRAPQARARAGVSRALQASPRFQRLAAVELLDRGGRRELAVGPAAARVAGRLDTAVLHADSGAVGRLVTVGDSVAYPVVVPIVERGNRLGYVVEWRYSASTPQSQRATLEMIGGSEAALFIGNRDGSAWTDMVRAVPGPPVDVTRTSGALEYDRPGAGRRLAVGRALVGVPWIVVVELPQRAVRAPAMRFLQRLAAMAVVLLALGMVGAWYFSRGITRPLLELTAVAEAAGAGDFSRRATAVRGDELGRLARVFNSMADRIETSVTRLTDSEHHYRMLFDSNPHPMWVLEQKGLQFLAVNAAAVQHYGYSAAEFLAMTALDICPVDDIPAFLATMAEPRSGVRLTAGWRHLKKDGTLIDVEVSSHPIVFEGRPAALVLAMDVTERKRAEQALRESEARFRQVTEHINEAFYLVDLTTLAPLYVSPNWSAIWGRPAADAYDPHIWFNAIHPDDQAGMRASQESVARGLVTTDTFRIIRPDGTTRWVRGRSFPVRNASGAVYRTVGVAEDVTELKRAREQSSQAQRIEAVGRLAGGVAHDFNNLLTVIVGHVELMQLEIPATHAAAESIEEIRKAAQRAASLTRQLLAFSRRQIIEPTTFLLNDLVVDLLKMLRRLIGEDIEIVTRLAPDAGAVRADRGQIEQVLINLAVNARDAMLRGGCLTIETAAVTLDEEYALSQGDVASGDYVVMAVTDTGTGMSEEVRARVFEPFFTTKEPGQGSGLGLATSYGIVKQSNGHISVSSEVGLGTTMKVHLPRVVGAISQDLPVQSAPLPRGSETILLAEDETAVRGVATRVLAAQGYRVLAARDGEEALRVAAAEAAIDLLVTDVVMPRMGGRELAERIIAIRPGLKILFATGYTDDAILQHKLSEHGVKVIRKPFTRESLARKVREVLDAAQGVPGPSEPAGR